MQQYEKFSLSKKELGFSDSKYCLVFTSYLGRLPTVRIMEKGKGGLNCPQLLISIEKDPKVVKGIYGIKNIPYEFVDNVKKWVSLNRSELLEYWFTDFETNYVFSTIKKFKPLSKNKVTPYTDDSVDFVSNSDLLNSLKAVK